MQFPAFYILTIYHFATGMTMPYKTRVANYLEVVLGSIVTLLLLLPQVTKLREEMDVFTISSHFDNSSYNNCDIELNLSRLSILLTPFYYLPIVIIVGVAIAHIGFQISRYSVRRCVRFFSC